MRTRRKRNGKGIMETAAADSEDRISALPDELLQHMMSFLLSRDAVQTCLLARRWRTLWKSVPALRIHDPYSYDDVPGCITFVDKLIRLRDPTPLDVCDISSDHEYACEWDEAFLDMEPWLEYALESQAQVLRIRFPCLVININLISSHLKKFQLYDMELEGTLDFSSCQVLEVLEMTDCDICVDIKSQSLKHLHVYDGCFGSDDRTRFYTPNVVGLKLAPSWGLIPFLGKMTSLVTASITLGKGCFYRRLLHEFDGAAGSNNCPIILDSLSGATNLELTIADPDVSIFRKDFKWCPMFSKLKTLLLNEWCMVAKFTGLIYFLQHSPVLETLTLRLDFDTSQKKRHVIERVERCNSREQSLLSKHLKLVKIVCDTKNDKRVHHIVRILLTHGVLSEQIDI
ncbi:MEIOTIC F-BOX protein MOF-like isoform X2 [Lolium rigidum]|uniref:MEIOTIC F-BOX protein MOF-like isoform X2 n=1 Tax=Lolium rigidum TaxID=89674 RepID=UPI001F5C9B66|nr:MEIOTIC F-BOX protein MOF-like isoform X2 [Lolium rigidum]